MAGSQSGHDRDVSLRDESFSDLDRIQRGPFQQLIARHEQSERAARRIARVAADATN
jgi:ABC-type proline/glycine betaine transport system ATPase subunit